MPRVVTAGETMFLLAPIVPGRLSHVGSLEVRVAGAETNVAIGLQRLEIETGWVSQLGTDELGDTVLMRVRAEGVDTSAVTRIDAPTGLMLRDRLPTGVRVFYYRAGSAASQLAPGAFDPEYLDGAEILHLTGVTPALSATCREFVTWAAREARRRSVKVSFDVNFRSKLWPAREAATFIDGFLPSVDLLFVSDDDARAIWGRADAAWVTELSENGSRDVVMTRGALGAYAVHAGETHDVPAMPIEPLDLVGCGDAFVAGYLAATLWGKPPSERVTIANAVGAYAALGHGDYEGLPTRAGLDAFLAGSTAMVR